MTLDELTDALIAEIKGLSQYFDSDDYENAIADAERETGWTLPVTAAFQELWIKYRSKRHLFFMLLSESAHKFKYEQINLQHRFEHYSKLIKTMDDQFNAVMEDRPEEFLDASGITDISAIMGTKVDAGFSYTLAGEDSTYSDDNVVNHFPSDS